MKVAVFSESKITRCTLIAAKENGGKEMKFVMIKRSCWHKEIICFFDCKLLSCEERSLMV